MKPTTMVYLVFIAILLSLVFILWQVGLTMDYVRYLDGRGPKVNKLNGKTIQSSKTKD
jgi:hypothetical protein